MTGSMIHQSLEGNTVNSLSAGGSSERTPLLADYAHHISANKEMIGVIWEEF